MYGSPTVTLPLPSSCAKAAVRVKRSINAPWPTSHWPKDKIERLRRVLKNEPLVHPDQLFVIERSLPHGHVELLLGHSELKLPALIDPRPSPKRDRVLAMILQPALPASKLATTRCGRDHPGRGCPWRTPTRTISTRPWTGCLSVRALSASWPSCTWLKATRCSMTSGSYYEGQTCPLMQFGHNRDGKRDRPIVV